MYQIKAKFNICWSKLFSVNSL